MQAEPLQSRISLEQNTHDNA